MHKNNHQDIEETPVSKSQLKRDAAEIHDLGKQLVAMQAKNLQKIPLPDTILEAVNVARKISAHGGLKRQHQYIAKRLRQIDVSEITAALNKVRGQSSQTNAAFKSTEQWRERLLSEDKQALAAFINTYPQVDIQQLRQLIRFAQKEETQNKPPKYSRELFRLLRNLIDQ